MATKNTVADTGLSEVDFRFCNEYLKTLNATDAYMKTRSKSGDTGRKGARVNAHRILAKPAVQKYLQNKSAERAAAADVSIDVVMSQLRSALMFDPRRYFDENGNLKPIHELDSECAYALAGIEVSDITVAKDGVREKIGQTSKIRFADRLAAIDKAMRYLGMFEKDNGQQAEALRKMIGGGLKVTFVRPNEDRD